MSIETNLLQRLVDLVETIEQRNAIIYITDSAGQVWVSDDPDKEIEIYGKGTDISSLVPAVADFFSGSDRHLTLDRRAGWIASRVPLDPANPQTNIGLVLQLTTAD